MDIHSHPFCIMMLPALLRYFDMRTAK